VRAPVNKGSTSVHFEDVLERLEGEGVRYVVVGGLALILHGFDRPTSDLDIVVDRAPAEAARAMRTLTKAGFVPTIPLPLTYVTVLRMSDRKGREIDVFARFQVPFAELWAGSELVRSSGTTVRVASVADLIRAMQLSGRPVALGTLAL
jgi:hypothetical protein